MINNLQPVKETLISGEVSSQDKHQGIENRTAIKLGSKFPVNLGVNAKRKTSAESLTKIKLLRKQMFLRLAEQEFGKQIMVSEAKLASEKQTMFLN